MNSHIVTRTDLLTFLRENHGSIDCTCDGLIRIRLPEDVEGVPLDVLDQAVLHLNKDGPDGTISVSAAPYDEGIDVELRYKILEGQT